MMLSLLIRDPASHTWCPAAARTDAPTGNVDACQATPSQCSTLVVHVMLPPADFEQPPESAIQTLSLPRTTREVPPMGTALRVHCSPLNVSASSSPAVSVPRIQTTPGEADAMRSGRNPAEPGIVALFHPC